MGYIKKEYVVVDFLGNNLKDLQEFIIKDLLIK